MSVQQQVDIITLKRTVKTLLVLNIKLVERVEALERRPWVRKMGAPIKSQRKPEKDSQTVTELKELVVCP